MQLAHSASVPHERLADPAASCRDAGSGPSRQDRYEDLFGQDRHGAQTRPIDQPLASTCGPPPPRLMLAMDQAAGAVMAETSSTTITGPVGAGPSRIVSAVARASGLDRIVALMSAIRPIGTRDLEHGDGATSGPPTCRARLHQVVLLPRPQPGLQLFSTAGCDGHDCQRLRASLIRKRSQVRVLDRQFR
jgi:hypothetical protein